MAKRVDGVARGPIEVALVEREQVRWTVTIGDDAHGIFLRRDDAIRRGVGAICRVAVDGDAREVLLRTEARELGEPEACRVVRAEDSEHPLEGVFPGFEAYAR